MPYGREWVGGNVGASEGRVEVVDLLTGRLGASSVVCDSSSRRGELQYKRHTLAWRCGGAAASTDQSQWEYLPTLSSVTIAVFENLHLIDRYLAALLSPVA